MASDRVSLFSRPDTVMRSHLTAEEQHLLAAGDPAVQWTAPSATAFVVRHWVQSALVIAGLVVVALLTALGAGGSVPMFIFGLVLCGLAVELALFEIRIFFRTYTRYVITPNRIMRMDGIIDRRSSAIDWGSITDISDQIGVLGQMFDYGDISIETANENSKFGALLDVPNPRRFLAAMNEARKKKAKTPVSEAALKALIALEGLLRDGALLVQPQVGEDGVRSGWRVGRESAPS